MVKKLLIILFVCITSAKAEIVSEIQVVGNERIDTETIKVYGNLEIKKNYSSEDLNDVIRNLYSTDFFEDVSLSLQNEKLTIKVKEYSVINTIQLNGEKSNSIKKLILERLSLKEKQSFISNKLSDDINLIKLIYSGSGYNFAQIEAKVEKFSNNRVNLLFNIDRGDKTFINQINFIGDKKIRESRLRSIIVSEENKFWKFLSKNTFYSPSNIDLDKRLLLNYYKSLGYYDVQILSNSSETINKQSIKLTYSINAGPRYKIRKISTNVAEVIDKRIFLDLENQYLKFIGDYYSPFKIKKLLDQVDLIISNNDLQFIEHSVSETLENNNIDVKINIFEGNKQIIQRVNVFGNTITDESVIRSELLLDEGDPFNNLKLEQSIAKLKARNLFGSVKNSVVESSNKNEKIIDIFVEEKPTGEISAGAGIGTSGGSFAFSVNENNWLGQGIGTSFFIDASSDTFTGGLTVNNPNYNFSGNSLNYFLTNTKNDKPDSGFKNNIISSGIGTKFEQFREIYISPNISVSYDDLKVDDTASTNLKKQKGTFTDLTFDYGITSDKRDRVYGPTSGYVLGFNQAFPIYADSPFIKNSFNYNSYYSFNENMVGAIKFYASAITGLNNKDVRLSKRILLNQSRLRGFEAGKIGPKDGADYVGGNYAAATNFELNLPNLLPESTNTDVGLFLDFGNVWHLDYDSTIDDSNKIRSSVGVNTSWLSPVGPMSFIFSQNISKASTDVTESFNFRLGTTF